jgi:LAS superfamily LD-carboxypeptidase LdcB
MHKRGLLSPFVLALVVPSIFALVLVALVWWRFTAMHALLVGDMRGLNTSMATTSAQLEQNIGALAEKLSAQEEKNAALSEELTQAQDDIRAFEKRFGKVSDNIEELEKLAKADPKLLQKYSKVFFLNEHYEPARLAQVKAEYLYSEDDTQRIHAQVLPFLTKMLDAAKKDGVELYVKSAFRSFEEQRATKSAFTTVYGAGTANTFSADQGYSEHQLGTTVDLITTGLGGILSTSFEGTAAFVWLTQNAHDYGFVLSYPKDNAYYIYEPWHWRFVGTELAEYLHKNGKYFYDLEQRKIDEYLPEMFD